MSAGSPKQRISSAKLPFRPRTTMFASVSQIAEPDASSRHGQSHLNMAASKKEIFKFPRTRHVYNTGGGASRDDLIMDAKEAVKFTQRRIVIEEKVDGANLGISISEDNQILFQNRSHHVNSATATQFKGLDKWVTQHPGIWDVLTSPDIILFGEWLFARHSINYTELPDYFLAFDIYIPSKGKFLSRAKREALLADTGIASVPLLGEGQFTKEQILAFLESPSSFYEGKVEGAYIRIEDDDFELERGKIVRPDFMQAIEEHWSTKTLVTNTVRNW